MNLGYTGKPYDTATGLYNYGYRDYRPETARFTTIDPIRDGNNWFAYVNNDPVNYVDLWGLSANEPEAKVQTTLSEQEIGNIVFNETRSLNGTGVQAARENIAHAIINADEKWGSNRSTYAGTAPATVTENAKNTDAEQYKSSQKAASDAVSTHLENDPTNGAVFFNFRSNDSRSNFQGAEIQTQVGPLNNSYPTADLPGTGIYANTYK
jgi:RHS repeat-associated protein